MSYILTATTCGMGYWPSFFDDSAHKARVAAFNAWLRKPVRPWWQPFRFIKRVSQVRAVVIRRVPSLGLSRRSPGRRYGGIKAALRRFA